MKNTRNYNIDFFRGIAVLSVIFIHTVFWSGETYTPMWLKSISLLLDVPFFVFISGNTFNFSNSFIKNIKGLLKIWYKWIVFLAIYVIILYLFDREAVSSYNLINWVVFNFPKDNLLKVVGGSIWFIPMFFQVSLFCTAVICLYKGKTEKLITITIFLFFIYLFVDNYSFLFINKQIAFYSIIYMLGYISAKYRIVNFKKTLLLLGLLTIVTVLSFFMYHTNFYNLQNLKGQNHLIYFLISLFSIFIFWYLKDKFYFKKENIVSKIGADAIFFYFSQGISSSIIILLLPKILFLKGVIILIIMFTLNILMATLIGFFLKYIYQIISKPLSLTKIEIFEKT